MKFMFTDEHPLMHMLDGHEVISGDHVFRSSHVDMEDPDMTDYPLKRILLRESPDVLVLVDLFKVFNGHMIWFNRPSFASWASASFQKTVVAISNSDNEAAMFAQNMCNQRSCVGKIDHCNIYVCSDLELANRASKYYRVAHFDGQNTAPFIRALSVAKSKPEMTGDPDTPYV